MSSKQRKPKRDWKPQDRKFIGIGNAVLRETESERLRKQRAIASGLPFIAFEQQASSGGIGIAVGRLRQKSPPLAAAPSEVVFNVPYQNQKSDDA
jgi:hypothetical protein